ncbi:MAG TPA: type I-E CRISPR-associated protein Cse1/CasA [Aquabacterium sp.]|nr:type I-E CRISPR-associated protein Cse1/CasA [Aquabacterium sp.]
MNHEDNPIEAAPSPAFNLLDSPWLPVRYLNGRQAELGLLAVFDQADQIEGLAETSPPNLVALYRLLLAITHRALTRQLGQWTDRDRARWYTQGLPAGAMADYLMHWRDRFWLFHPDHPFMQVAALASAEETRDKRKPWTQVSLQCANGNTPVVFDHTIDTAPQPAAASVVLRDLLGFLQFTPGGLVKVFRSADKSGPLANTAAAIPIGAHLMQTLLLALHPSPQPGVDDLPSWEVAEPTVGLLTANPRPAAGSCDRYTRQSRSVLLLHEASHPTPSVRWIRFGAGLALADDDNAPDAMASYRHGSAGLVRVTFTEGRALWRDMGALLPDETGQFARPAAVLSWAANLHNAAGLWDADIPILLAGLCSDQAKLVRWRSERHALPSTSLQRADMWNAVRDELLRCEELFKQLRMVATDLLARTMPDPNSKDTRSRARALLDAGPFAATFFSTAERRLPALLQRIGRAELDAAHADWSAALLQAANNAWGAARGMLGQSAAALRAEALTHRRLQAALRPLRREPDASPAQQPRPIEEATP